MADLPNEEAYAVRLPDFEGPLEVLLLESAWYRGRVALLGDAAHATTPHLGQGAGMAIEDSLGYMEPPTWYYPTRQSLGRALLEAGRAKDAERVYREDLRRFPDNGWSLTGLSLALAAQGKRAEAATVRQQLDEVWKDADVKLVSSRF